MIERNERKPYWRHTKVQMLTSLLPFVLAMIVLPLYADALNDKRILGIPLGYFLASVPNLNVAYLPTPGIQPEVDFVVTVGTVRIPIEVKYRRHMDPFDDTRALRAFLERTINNAPFGLLVTQEDGVQVQDPRIIPISLSAFLWTR